MYLKDIIISFNFLNLLENVSYSKNSYKLYIVINYSEIKPATTLTTMNTRK